MDHSPWYRKKTQSILISVMVLVPAWTPPWHVSLQPLSVPIPKGHFCQTLFLTKSVFLSPLSRWPQGQEGTHLDHLWAISSLRRHRQWVIEDLKLPENTGVIAASAALSSKGSWATTYAPQRPLLCVSPALWRRGPCKGWLPSSQPSLWHHFTNLLLEEKSSSIVILEPD